MSPRRAPRRPGGTLRDSERRQLAYAKRREGQEPPPVQPSPTHRVLCDGGSRGNPGPAAIAAVLLAPSGQRIAERATPIGRATAAEAEYRAIALGLELAAAHRIDAVEVRSDSRLAVEAVADADNPLGADLRAQAGAFADVRWSWHPRDANEAADALVRALLWP